MHDMYVNLTLLAFITMVSPASMEKSKLEEVELYKELQVVRLIAYENKLASYIKKKHPLLAVRYRRTIPIFTPYKITTGM